LKASEAERHHDCNRAAPFWYVLPVLAALSACATPPAAPATAPRLAAPAPERDAQLAMQSDRAGELLPGLEDRIGRLERDLAALRTDMQAIEPGIKRLMEIEGDIRLLLTQLAGLSGTPAAEKQKPATVAAAPMTAPRQLASIDPVAPPEPTPLPVPAPAARPAAVALPPAADTFKPLPPPSAPQAVTPAVDPLDPAAGNGIFGLHLASYRQPAQVAQGWEQLRQLHGSQLASLSPRVIAVDFGDGRGTFYRLKAGPVRDAQAAAEVCRSFTSKGEFCDVTDFSGTPGEEFWRQP
jgi:hypothetical protein